MGLVPSYEETAQGSSLLSFREAHGDGRCLRARKSARQTLALPPLDLDLLTPEL